MGANALFGSNDIYFGTADNSIFLCPNEQYRFQLFYTPGRDGTRNTERGPEAGVRGASPGVWVRRTGDMYAYTEGGLSPIAILSVCLCVCPSVRPNLNFQIIQIKHTHFPTQFSSTLNTRMPPLRCPWATRPIHARCTRAPHFTPQHRLLCHMGLY